MPGNATVGAAGVIAERQRTARTVESVRAVTASARTWAGVPVSEIR